MTARRLSFVDQQRHLPSQEVIPHELHLTGN
jgi:hypothetical protein